MMWLLLVPLTLVSAEFYETFSGKQISPFKFEEYRRLNLVPYCAQEIQQCNETEPRRIDLSCNNLHSPIRGTINTPYRRMLPPKFGRNFDQRPAISGAPLPPERSVRTSLLSDGRVADKTYTYMVLNGLLAITGDVTTIHDTFHFVLLTPTCCITGESDPQCRPIYVPNEDIHLRYSPTRCLNQTREITFQDLGCAPQTLHPERINLATPMLEVSQIYGNVEVRARRGREMQGGRLKVDIVNGREWPPTGSYLCVQNQVAQGEVRCHDSPNLDTNLLIGPNVLAIWLYRHHNRIARELELMNPCWDDERIYRTAREINIAMVNQIWYYEMFPALMGYKYLQERGIIYDTLGHVNDYNPKLEPRVSLEWITMTRWFHTMQDGRLNKYTNKGKLLEELKVVDLTLRTGILPMNNTIEGITQAFFRQPAAAADHLIDPEMGERVLGTLQSVSDIASLDLSKSRQEGLPPYLEYREHCRLPVPKDFNDLMEWMPREKVEALRFRYESVEDIDLMAGIWSEKLTDGPIPPTLKCVMADQLWYWRKADRFWYENNQHPGAFTEEQLLEIRRSTMSRNICDYGEEVDSVQPNAFILPGPGNEITDCKNLPTVSLTPWRDQCGINPEQSSPQLLKPQNEGITITPASQWNGPSSRSQPWSEGLWPNTWGL